MQTDLTYVALLSVIDHVKHSISNISATWNTERECDHDLMRALTSHAACRDIDSAIYWLFIRLCMRSKLKYLVLITID